MKKIYGNKKNLQIIQKYLHDDLKLQNARN